MKTPFITLKHLNIEEIHNKYQIAEIYKNKKSSDDIPNTQKQKSQVVDVHISNDNIYSYVDDSKKKHDCMFTMKDYLSKKELNSKNLNCFWCRHKFRSTPIGAPIEYVSNRIHKQYLNEYTKSSYAFSEHFTNEKLNISSHNHNKNNFKVEKEKRDFYYVDGVFCSFNCTKAFIMENKKNSLYSNSISLLHKIYLDLFPDMKLEIIPAPSWRLLKEYGGDLTIEEFRKNFNKDVYEKKDIIKELPSFKSIGYVFEKQIKL